jgi:uncharacterized membrane protein YidH (DUF202 family)
MEREPDKQPRSEIHLAGARLADPNDDGTRQLLRTGIGTLVVGIIAALLTRFVFGGIGIQGPHTNSGWLSLLLAMGCLPFGFLLTLLGTAKWLRNRRLREQRLESTKK